MLKLSVLLLVGIWLSFPRDFLHQKFTQLLSFSAIWHRPVKCKLLSSFVLYNFLSYGSSEL